MAIMYNVINVKQIFMILICFFSDYYYHLKLGGGGVQGQGKGQRLMTTFGWQHAKVESTKSNPPTPLCSKMLSC